MTKKNAWKELGLETIKKEKPEIKPAKFKTSKEILESLKKPKELKKTKGFIKTKKTKKKKKIKFGKKFKIF